MMVLKKLMNKLKILNPEDLIFIKNIGKNGHEQKSVEYNLLRDEQDNRYFEIKADRCSSIDVNKIQPLIKYSQQETNHLVEIYYYEKEHVITKYYKDYFPLIVVQGNKELYSKEKLVEIKEFSMAFLSNFDQIENLWIKLKKEYENLYKEAHLFHKDISGNNLLINNKLDFKIIDIHSISDKIEDMTVNPLEQFLIKGCNNLNRQKIFEEFISEKLINNIVEKLKTLE